MLTIDLPLDKKDFFIAHLNTLHTLAELVTRIRDQDKDPLPAYYALSQFPNFIEELTKQYEEILSMALDKLPRYDCNGKRVS